MTVQIQATHFTAGVVMHIENGVWTVQKAAPIVGYMRGWDWPTVRQYLASKRWQFSFVGD